jgi:hypothetical protein
MMEEVRKSFNSEFFMEVFIIGAWQIWKERNNIIFNRAHPSFSSWKTGFLDEVAQQSNGLKDNKEGFVP